MEDSRQIKLPRYLRDRLQRRAFDEGLTLEEKLSQLLDEDEGIYPEEDASEAEQSEDAQELDDKAREERWREDLNQLVQEHDREIWLMTAISKLIHLGKRNVSQFSYLRELKLQT